MKNQSKHKLATISFVVETVDGIDLWPLLGGDPIQSARLGRLRATEVIDYAVKNQAPMILGHVSAAIISKGIFGAGETAFFHAVAVHCMKSSVDDCALTEQSFVVKHEVQPKLQLVTN